MQFAESNPQILQGTPVFKGTRVPVQTLIDYLEGGDSINTFLDDFPSVSREQVLAALEAALSGCAVVVTPNGCTREYFGDLVAYARPDRPAEIGRAILRAWREGPHSGLAAHVTSHYLWSHVARRTAEVYDQVAG